MFYSSRHLHALSTMSFCRRKPSISSTETGRCTLIFGVKYLKYFTPKHPIFLPVHISNTHSILPLLSTLLPSVQSGTSRNGMTNPFPFFLTFIDIRPFHPTLHFLFYRSVCPHHVHNNKTHVHLSPTEEELVST